MVFGEEKPRRERRGGAEARGLAFSLGAELGSELLKGFEEALPFGGGVGGVWGALAGAWVVEGSVVPAVYAWAELAGDVVMAHDAGEGDVVLLHEVAGETDGVLEGGFGDVPSAVVRYGGGGAGVKR